MVASPSHYIPTFHVNLHFWGLGGQIVFGGQHIGPAFQAISEYQRSLSSQDSYKAVMAAKIGSYARREQDWAFQSANVAAKSTKCLSNYAQHRFTRALPLREWHNHQKQMKNAREIVNFLTNEKKGKNTNQAFYTWIKREVRSLYGAGVPVCL